MTEVSGKKQRVALASVFASGGMALAKLAVGLASGSLAILSEALHSLLDFAATVLTLFAVRMADKPADEGHHYGHGKVESIAALIETGLLFVTSAWIVQEAVKRLIWHDAKVAVTPAAVAVIAASVGIDLWRSRALARVARETHSQALEADALHFWSDMWSSLVVLAGLAVVKMGFPDGDAFAAVAVAIFVSVAGWRLGKRTIDVLMDAAPAGAALAIAAAARKVDGVVSVDAVRVRPAGSVLFADVSVEVPRAMPLDRVSVLKAEVARAIAAATPGAEVSVTTTPVANDDESIRERVMVIAANRQLAVHHVTVQSLRETLSISLDLEVDQLMPLGRAHEVASELETAITEEFGPDTEVETHIEPLQDDVEGRDVDEGVRQRLSGVIEALANNGSGLVDAHNVRARDTVAV